ncbi:hypothetical protein GCM10009753_79320 [Streptantibioticus ferralitis]
MPPETDLVHFLKLPTPIIVKIVKTCTCPSGTNCAEPPGFSVAPQRGFLELLTPYGFEPEAGGFDALADHDALGLLAQLVHAIGPIPAGKRTQAGFAWYGAVRRPRDVGRERRRPG